MERKRNRERGERTRQKKGRKRERERNGNAQAERAITTQDIASNISQHLPFPLLCLILPHGNHSFHDHAEIAERQKPVHLMFHAGRQPDDQQTVHEKHDPHEQSFYHVHY